MYKVFLTGRDYINWATDDDHRLTSQALSAFCDFVPIEEAEIIHAVNWHSFAQYNPQVLNKKYVIAHIPHDIRNMLAQKEFSRIAPLVNKFIVPSKRAEKMLFEIGLTGEFVPYPIDTEAFYPLKKDDQRIKEIKEKYGIPEKKYLIGSFQRDTEGKDLKTPKYIKGPDVFFNIVRKIYKTHKNIHVVLDGPRRFWIRERLEKEGIPYTFIGERVEGRDDLTENTLPHEVMNVLYNLIDSYIVSSRMEGGPKAVLEAAAAKCKIASAKVGHAEDILANEAVFDAVDIGYSIIVKDIESGYLNKTIDANYSMAMRHSIKETSKLWEKVYSDIKDVGKPDYKICFKEIVPKAPQKNLLNLFGKKNIHIMHTFHKPPWGGGNQFLLALKKEFEEKGEQVSNKINSKTTACLFNSFTFDFSELSNVSGKRNCKLVHRVDGPTFLIRGKDKELDDKVFDLNNQLADVTVFQSYWSFVKTIEAGYRPVNPILISNAVDAEIFNREGKSLFSKNRKIKLISTSWSDNPRKGYDTYKWLDENLAWHKYEYTFVGNVPGKFDNIKMVQPLPPRELADVLRMHDIYITASINDPCSNALIEALSCGLPALYLNSGGHPELVGYGGLPFNNKDEILPQLDRLVENYEMFQNSIFVPRIVEIADRYLALLKN